MPAYDGTIAAGTIDGVLSQPKPPGVDCVASVASKWSSQPRALCVPKVVSRTPK